MKDLKILKVTCASCGHLNLVPIGGALGSDESVKCEKCGRVLVKRE